MAYIPEEYPAGSAAERSGNSYLNWLSGAFVAIMNSAYATAKHRLPQVEDHEEDDVETKLKKRNHEHFHYYY